MNLMRWKRKITRPYRYRKAILELEKVIVRTKVKA